MSEYINYFKMMSSRSEKTVLSGTSGKSTNMTLVCSRENAKDRFSYWCSKFADVFAEYRLNEIFNSTVSQCSERIQIK